MHAPACLRKIKWWTGAIAYRLGALICKLDCVIYNGLHFIVNVLDLGLAQDGLLQHKVPELGDGVPGLQQHGRAR